MEVTIYEIKIKILNKKKTFINWFQFLKRPKVIYQLVYRIDEDRFWFKKIKNRKIIEEHHMKNNFINSVLIMDGIHTRLNKLLPFLGEYDMKVTKLSEINPELSELIRSIGKKSDTDFTRLSHKTQLKGMLID